MLELHNLKSQRAKKNRLGRGESSGCGKTSGKGSNGQKARSNDMPKGFEGGQTPFKWRLPKIKGFRPHDPKYQVVTLEEIERNFKSGEKVDIKNLLAKKLILDVKIPVKIIGNSLKLKLEFSDCLFSKGAERAINEKSKIKSQSPAYSDYSESAKGQKSKVL